MTIWVLPQSLTPQEEADVEKRTHLALPFGDLPDLSGVYSNAGCQRLLVALHPELPPESIIGKADRIWKYYSGLNKEDIIAVPLPASKEVALAEVSGPYVYEAGHGGSDAHHLMPVVWHNRLSPRLSAKYADVFAVRSGSMAEVDSEQVRIAIRDRLPHSYNRFVKWKWLLGLFFALGLIRMAQQTFHP